MLLQRQKSLCAAEHFACLPQWSLLVPLFSSCGSDPQDVLSHWSSKEEGDIKNVFLLLFRVTFELLFKKQLCLPSVALLPCSFFVNYFNDRFYFSRRNSRYCPCGLGMLEGGWGQTKWNALSPIQAIEIQARNVYDLHLLLCSAFFIIY